MSTLIDGSCLLTPQPTGVPIVVRQLIQQKLLPIEDGATLFTTRFGAVSHPLPESQLNHLHRRIPSKAVHAYCLAGGSLEQLAPGTWSRLFLPNINIVGLPRIPFDLLVHDISFLIHPPWFSLKTRVWHTLAQPRSLIKHAERLFVLSPQTAQALIDVCSVDRAQIHLVAYQPESRKLSTPSRPIAEPYFLLLASGDPRKNCLCIERAFEAFCKTYPHWKLVLVGGPHSANHPSIIHLPYLAPSERLRWMQHAAALLYPSWYEGFGLPMHEAASLGIPVLASSALTVARTAPKGTLFLPPFTPQAWTEAFQELAKTV